MEQIAEFHIHTQLKTRQQTDHTDDETMLPAHKCRRRVVLRQLESCRKLVTNLRTKLCGPCVTHAEVSAFSRCNTNTAWVAQRLFDSRARVCRWQRVECSGAGSRTQFEHRSTSCIRQPRLRLQIQRADVERTRLKRPFLSVRVAAVLPRCRGPPGCVLNACSSRAFSLLSVERDTPPDNVRTF